MKKLTILLALIIPVSLFSQNISVKSFKEIPNDMTARVTAPVTDQNGDKCALIKIVTTQTGFVFESDMLGITKTVQKVGEIWMYVPEKAKRLTIKHQKLGILRNYLYPTTIKEATVYYMELTTAKVTTVVEEIETPMQWLTINSDPEGADVYINNDLVGTTPYAKKMEIGKYNYRIEKFMYYKSVGAITLTQEKKEALNINLKPNFGYVKITTTPESGAKIEIDHQPVNNVTPYTSQKLLSGKHTVLVKKVMFKNKTVDFEINDKQTTNLNIDLKPNFAEITIETRPQADIYIDDEKKGTGTYTGRLMPGLHTFEAKKDKHEPDKKQLEFVAGENRTLSLHPLAKTGKVDIISTPFDATIKLNNKDYGTTPNTIKNLLIGDYTLTLEKTSYGTITKTITIKEGETTQINETLSAGMQITITSQPTGAILYIDQQNKGTTPKTFTLSFGKHTIKIDNEGAIKEEIINIVQNGKNSFKYEVNHNKGSFTDKRDNKTYKWVKIGMQVWMAENLAYKSNKGCWAYGDKQSNVNQYGYLYNWETAKKVCPDGWHLPSDAEWTELTNYIVADGHSGTEGTVLKATSGWNSNGNGTDDYGFSALPGGYRGLDDGAVGSVGDVSYWWSSTEYDSSDAWRRTLYYTTSGIYCPLSSKSGGFSVRCVRDN